MSFGSSGLGTTAVGSAVTYCFALAIQSDGKVVALGSNTPTSLVFRTRLHPGALSEPVMPALDCRTCCYCVSNGSKRVVRKS